MNTYRDAPDPMARSALMANTETAKAYVALARYHGIIGAKDAG